MSCSKIKLKFFELLAILEVREVHNERISKTHTKTDSETHQITFSGNSAVTVFLLL